MLTSAFQVPCHRGVWMLVVCWVRWWWQKALTTLVWKMCSTYFRLAACVDLFCVQLYVQRR